MKFGVHNPFVELLGMELLSLGPDHCEIAITLRPELTNSWEVAHGGVSMTLLDVVMAHAARSPLAEGGDPPAGVVTVEMKTTFLRPGLGRLLGRGTRLHRTATLAFCEASVLDAGGQRVAHATGTFKFMRSLPAGDGGRRIRKLNASD